MASQPVRSGKITVAVVAIALQAGLLFLSGVLVWAMNAARRQRFVHRFWYDRIVQHPRLAGLVFVLVAIGLVVLAVGVARRRSWAPLPTYVVEGVLVVASVLRFHPLRTLLGIALAVTVIVLVATERESFAAGLPEGSAQ